MKIIDQYNSFTLSAVKERENKLANFLIDNPGLDNYWIIKTHSFNKIHYRLRFCTKKYWVAYYSIETIRFKTGTILSHESSKFLLNFLDTSIKLTPYKIARSNAFRRLKYSSLPRIVIYWMLCCHLKYSLIKLKATKELIQNAFIIAQLIMDINLQSLWWRFYR